MDCKGAPTHQEIHSWLKMVYGTESIPSYEVNETTLITLQLVMTQILQRKKHSQIIAENLRRKALEYNAEGQRLHKILHGNSIALSSNLQSNVSSLAAAGCVLSLKDVSTTSFISSIQRMLQNSIKVTASRKEESQISDKLSAETIIMQQRMQQLTRELKEAEKWSIEHLPEVNQNSKNTFLKSKIEQYNKDLNYLEVKLHESGVDPKIYHGELMKNSEIIKDFQKKLDSVHMKLQSYKCLPANEDLARVKLAEAEMELEKLERELSLKLENVIPNVNPI